MEAVQSIFSNIYSLLAELIWIWPVLLLAIGLFFLLQASKNYRQYVRRTFLTTLALGVILYLIIIAGNAYSTKAVPYQQVGLAIYYIVLLAWIIPMMRNLNSNRKK